MAHLIKKLKVLSEAARIEDAIRFRFKSNKKNVFITKLLLFPYIFIYGGGEFVYSKILRLRHQNENDKAKGLAIVAICKNESPYILEWIAFHKIIGIDHIFIYNNGSTDDTVEKIRKIFDKDFVSIIDFPGEKKQFPAYNDALLRFGKDFRYMAFIDCDEFIMPKAKGMNIEKYLDTLTKNNAEAGSICINWCMYGSSGLLHKTNDLILEKFLNRGEITKANGNGCIKSIVLPSRVKGFRHAHYPRFKIGYYGFNISGDIVYGWENDPIDQPAIRINHYFTKSLEEWIERRKLGKADNGSNDKRTLEEFHLHDDNSVCDKSSLDYVDEIKKLIGNSPLKG